MMRNTASTDTANTILCKGRKTTAFSSSSSFTSPSTQAQINAEPTSSYSSYLTPRDRQNGLGPVLRIA